MKKLLAVLMALCLLCSLTALAESADESAPLRVTGLAVPEDIEALELYEPALTIATNAPFDLFMGFRMGGSDPAWEEVPTLVAMDDFSMNVDENENAALCLKKSFVQTLAPDTRFVIDFDGGRMLMYLSDLTAENSGKFGTVVCETQVNLRAEPSTKADIVTTFPNSLQVVVTGEAQDNFIKVVCGPFEGWMSADYVVFDVIEEAPAEEAAETQAE